MSRLRRSRRRGRLRGARLTFAATCAAWRRWAAPLEAGLETSAKRNTRNTRSTRRNQTLKLLVRPVQATGADARATRAGRLPWRPSGAKDKAWDLAVRSGSRRPEGFIRAAHDLLKAAGEHVGGIRDALVAIAFELGGGVRAVRVRRRASRSVSGAMKTVNVSGTSMTRRTSLHAGEAGGGPARPRPGFWRQYSLSATHRSSTRRWPSTAA